MSTQDTDFFLERSPLREGEGAQERLLKPWHRLLLCVSFLALMVVYTKWLLEV
jgi:hypothetical protein